MCVCVCVCVYTSLTHTHDQPLYRLLRLKRRHRDIMDTIIDLVPRLISVALLVVVIYYVFAIIGIETLHDLVYPGCW